MQLDRKIVVFGAGQNGERIMYRLGEANVAFFCDNYKSGTEFLGKKVIGFSELVKINQNSEYDVILSTNADSIRKQLDDAKIHYWESSGMVNNFFCQETIWKTLDEELLNQYLELDCYDGRGDKAANWFRQDYRSDKNKRLVQAMENGNRDIVSRILADTYDNNTQNRKELYEDEYYVNRPGMRLIAGLIRRDEREKVNVCDLACGHGDFLKELKSGKIVCYGADVSSERCRSLKVIGIECRLGGLENSGYRSGMFDYVTMMECLEHVADPFLAMKEAYRILKGGGQILVTVPYGTNCDSDMHVRQFYEDDLYSVARECGYTDIRIMKLPYLNGSFDDNLIMTAKRE